MDHPTLNLSGFNEILECYHESINAYYDCCYFFDEVHYQQTWDKWLKTIYDMHPDTNVMSTGSDSPAFMKWNNERGAGRWSIIHMPTMSFYEYCELLNIYRPDLAASVNITSPLHKSQQERTQIMLQLSKVYNHFARYLQIVGFRKLELTDNDLKMLRERL